MDWFCDRSILKIYFWKQEGVVTLLLASKLVVEVVMIKMQYVFVFILELIWLMICLWDVFCFANNMLVWCDSLGYAMLVRCDSLGNDVLVRCDSLGNDMFVRCDSLGNDVLVRCDSLGNDMLVRCDSLGNDMLVRCDSLGYDMFVRCDSLGNDMLVRCDSLGNDMFVRCDSLGYDMFVRCDSLGNDMLVGCDSLVNDMLVRGDSWLIDWYFISKKCTYIHINNTYRQIKSFICIQTYMYHLAATRETTSSLSKLAAFRLVSTWFGHKLII